jgi:hypothetical protein
MRSDATEPQPGITAIVATVAQLGEGWTSNRVMVLLDPLSSPREIADPHENAEGLLRMARDLLTKEPRREAYGVKHLKRLAEVLDSNLLKAQKALATGGQGPARQ